MNDLFWLDTGGSGRPLVLLHGGFLDHGMWADQLPFFAGRHRVIVPDARGHGHSANATGPYRLADELAALLRHLDTGPAVLAGVSMGAGIAVDTALEHPELVRAVVVSGAGTSEPSFTDPWTTRALAAWNASMAAGDLEGSIEGFMLFAAGPHRAVADLDPRVEGRLRRMARATMSKHAVGEPAHLVPVHDTWKRLPEIEVPVLAVNGDLDSPDHLGMAERLVAAVPDGRAVRVGGAAHYPNMEHPGEFNEIVGEFLSGV
ncbi:alpha/beta fold hydrolase [Nonomuraea sp. NPDC050783]|uniref:alpha/beta fold hydrolase n=1 Tax=Nonomuraea sp. NPDC050783 TaxID=3154634 RepID=UPI003465CAEE